MPDKQPLNHEKLEKVSGGAADLKDGESYPDASYQPDLEKLRGADIGGGSNEDHAPNMISPNGFTRDIKRS